MNSLPPPGTGYFVEPASGPGEAVLVIPSPWGLTDHIKAKAHSLADAGFSVLAPDLSDGHVAGDNDEAHTMLMEADMNVSASLVQSSLRLLRAASADPQRPAGVVGYAAGASWALWLSVRFADQCAAVAAYDGTQSISFDDAAATYLLHFADEDPDVSDDDIALMGLNLQVAERDFSIVHHPGVRAGFAEDQHPNFDALAEATAWQQTMAFLATHLS